MRIRVTFQYDVESTDEITPQEAIDAVIQVTREWRRKPTSTTTIHRQVDRPADWDIEKSGAWIESLEFVAQQPIARVRDAGLFAGPPDDHGEEM